MGTKRRPKNLNEDEPEPVPQGSLPLQPPVQHCIALHRSRHWAWSPSTVVAISACPAAPLAAIGYESGDLELWDLVHITCIQRIVGEGVEVTALAWACDSLDGSWRTFCAALDGSLAEVHWKAGKLESSTDSGAGAIWSLAAQPAAAVSPGFAHSLAASCDDGSVRIFHVEGGEAGAHYSRTLARLQGRALAVAWHPSGSALVAGGADGCIHVLDPSNGSEHLRITAGAATTRPVCVWRLAVLPNGTIVSGDSDGAVQFWDGRFGSLLHRFTQHRADILAVVSAPDGESIFASGVDPAVVQFRHTQGDVPNTLSSKTPAEQQGSTKASGSNGGGQWVYTHHKRPHSHDVRAMDVVRLGGGRAVLLSGGVDTQLIAYPVASFLEEHPARLTKCPQRPMCHLALGAMAGGSLVQPQQQQQQQQQQQLPLLLCAQHDLLDVWQVARTVASSGTLQQQRQQQQQQQQQQLNGHDGLGGSQGEGEDGQHGPLHIAGETVDLTSAPRHLARISGRPTFWSLEYSTEIAACLERLPGTPVGCSFSPDPASRQLMVYSPGGFCTLDTESPPDCAAAQRSRLGHQKRRRGPLAPHLHNRPTELSSLGGSEVAGGPCLDAAPGLRGKAVSHGGASSNNGRAILLRDPCAFLGHLSPSEAILLEKPWEDVASTFAPPLYTHRYGS
ncbi:WD40-repeat-containing domain protein [Dunaliella salina]|uniref:WD40-repeat-containing domain protein n=1 Tax=Dunaliella salina TaxID=3046 RepID=A0ABQ7FW12_DUNSA|nr:WD40-repeat-containing domain protein [Dunaliella salina]|eukprot:KAF5826564.1 WD40-repeat-containing domain protein [Dunaliella salina]